MSEEKKNDLPEEELEEEETDIFTLTDEDGNESEFGLLDQYRTEEGDLYYALVPLKADGTEEEEYVILKCTEDENGEVLLVTVDDDDEFDRIADIFDDRLFSEIDYDDTDDGNK